VGAAIFLAAVALVLSGGSGIPARLVVPVPAAAARVESQALTPTLVKSTTLYLY